MKNGFFFALLISCALPAFAVKYYVDPTSGVDSRQNWEAQQFFYPWRHVQNAITRSAPGDTLLLGPGDYTERVTITKKLTIIGFARDITVIKYPTDVTFGTGVTINAGIDDV